MAQFIGLVTLNAANFDSGAATDGQVLTADGSGGAAWEDASGGGGGASFAFDGATFTPDPAYTPGDNERLCTVEITKGGNSIASGSIALRLFLTQDTDCATSTNGAIFNGISAGAYAVSSGGADYMIAAKSDGSKIEFSFFVYNDAEEITVYANIILPDGSIISSNGFTVGNPA